MVPSSWQHPETPDGIGTCSDGWTGKVFPRDTREPVTTFIVSNPIGALTAAALTAGEAFLRFIGLSRPSRGFELSAWSGACGPLGSLPDDPHRADALPRTCECQAKS